MEKNLNLTNLEAMRKVFLADKVLQTTQNAVMENGIKKSITNRSVIEQHPFAFSVDVDTYKPLNQNKSGRY